MKFLLVTILLCCASKSLCTAHKGHHHHVRRELAEKSEELSHAPCSTREPEERDYQARSRARTLARFKNARRGEDFEAESQEVRTITVCFHNPQFRLSFLSKWTNTQVSNEDLQKELDHLNEAFTSSSCCDSTLPWCNGECSEDIPIRFVMARVDADGNVIGTTDSTSDSDACITRPRGFRWMWMSVIGLNQILVKRALRVGDATTLNVYYIRSGVLPFTPVLGYATFPWDYSKRPKMDGVVIEPTSVAGSTRPFYNEGDTLVHEVGHWLGLFHTFHRGCARGDGIDDTPAQASSSRGCAPEEKKDTCPGSPGLDPIHNFLDYSYDACMYTFTPGQAAVMLENVDAYRSSAQTGNLGRESVYALTDGIVSNLQALAKGDFRVFTLDVPETAAVACILSSAEGGLDLFMNWTGEFERFDCQDISEENEKVCSMVPSSGTAYAIVYAKGPSSSSFLISCNSY